MMPMFGSSWNEYDLALADFIYDPKTGFYERKDKIMQELIELRKQHEDNIDNNNCEE